MIVRFIGAAAIAVVCVQPFATAQAADDSSGRPAPPPESFLPKFLRDDPTQALAQALQLSPQQQEHARACYKKQYREAAAALGQRIYERLEREGHWPEYHRLGAEASAELVRAASRSYTRAVNASLAEYLAIEQECFDCIAEVIAEEHLPACRRMSMTIQRQS